MLDLKKRIQLRIFLSQNFIIWSFLAVILTEIWFKFDISTCRIATLRRSIAAAAAYNCDSTLKAQFQK